MRRMLRFSRTMMITKILMSPILSNMDGVTRLCFDLVVFDDAARVFRFAHTSVQDYLVNHSHKFQTRCDSHVRLAERSISILIHIMKTRREHFPKFPVEDKQPQVPEDDGSKKNILKSREGHRREGSLEKRPLTKLMNLRLATYTRVHPKQLDIETLQEYEIPWGWNQASLPHCLSSCLKFYSCFTCRGSDYILIPLYLLELDQEILFEHTRLLRVVRERRQRERADVLGDAAIVSRQGVVYPVMDRSTTEEKSRLHSRSSGDQDSQVLDFRYFDLPFRSEMNLRESFETFVAEHWALYTASSEDLRYIALPKELEDEIQSEFARQSWETVRPCIYFSACVNGLTSHVQAWTEAYHRLAKTAQRCPLGTTALVKTV